MGSGMALSFGCSLVQDLEQIFMTLEGIRKRPTGVNAVQSRLLRQLTPASRDFV